MWILNSKSYMMKNADLIFNNKQESTLFGGGFDYGEDLYSDAGV